MGPAHFQISRRLRALLLIGAIGISGCGAERVLSVSFEQDKADDPPKVEQELGHCHQPAIRFGTVFVERLGGSKVVQLTQAEQEGSPHAKLSCAFPVSRGDGRYLFTMRVMLPSGGAGRIVFQKDNGANPNDFFVVELPADGRLRAPGSTTSAGRFPHDKFFSVAVNLRAGPSSTIEVTLLGEEAQGSFTASVGDPVNTFARNFSAVQLETGSREPGSSFVADDLLVIFNPPETRR